MIDIDTVNAMNQPTIRLICPPFATHSLTHVFTHLTLNSTPKDTFINTPYDKAYDTPTLFCSPVPHPFTYP